MKCLLYPALLIATVLFIPAYAQNPVIPESYNSGWALHMDNDLFVSSTKDRDYTGGIALTLSGTRAQKYLFGIDSLRERVDGWFGLDRFIGDQPKFQLHSIEGGFVLFTPADLSVAEPQIDDHPYASLFFLVNSEQTVLPQSRMAVQSVLTLGVLGSGLAEQLQRGIHSVTGSEEPRGWNNQISAGGEFTFKYSVGIQKTVLETQSVNNLSSEVKITGETSVGFSTGVNVGVNARFGRISTPWWGFNPHQAEYVNLGSPVAKAQSNSSFKEAYFYIGVTAKLRLYNSILQGQFRDSKVQFNRDELEPVVFEALAGSSFELADRWSIGAFARARTAELSDDNARRPVWGGLLLSRSF